jgi:hypothetical protein
MKATRTGCVGAAAEIWRHEARIHSTSSPELYLARGKIGADGEERLLGEYLFQHTRTIPGPHGWKW